MIEVRDLTFSYRHALDPAVHDLSFRIEEGEVFGFLGPSGAGKSTTQKILIGLLPGYRGEIRVMDRELREWGPAYYERVGVSFELPNHHQRLTARENLEHFGSLYAGETLAVDEVLRLVGLEADADKRVSDFSKGMKIRLNLARSLVHRPRLLFLDEPTGGLDPVNARRVKELVVRLQQEGTTVFLTTHDMAVADQLCDRVAFITEGEIRKIGVPDALKREYGKREVRVSYRGEDDPRAEAVFPLDGLGDDEEFLRLLRSGTIDALHSQETTLENVFIEVTGQRLTA